MTTYNKDKIKILFKDFVPGSIVTSKWLEEKGVSRSLQKHYLRSGWLEAFGRGAYKKPGDTITWQGAINAIQQQSELDVHVGAGSALTLHGFSHYLRLNRESLFLFTPHKKHLPKWFLDANWDFRVLHKQTEFLPAELGLTTFKEGNFPIKVSTPERAMLECLYLAPKLFDLVECYHLMEGMVNLKPKLLSELLAECSSVKVKRLFLYMAEKAGHQWLNFVKTGQINLGNGNRMLTKKGVYVSKYQLSIPKDLAEL